MVETSKHILMNFEMSLLYVSVHRSIGGILVNLTLPFFIY